MDTQKDEKTHRRNKKQNRRDEGRKPNDNSFREKTKQVSRKKTGINAEKVQASIPENQITVTCTDDELVSFKDNIVTGKNTQKSASTYP